jgi:hypothetical protein
VARGEWRVARGAWRVASGAWRVACDCSVAGRHQRGWTYAAHGAAARAAWRLRVSRHLWLGGAYTPRGAAVRHALLVSRCRRG